MKYRNAKNPRQSGVSDERIPNIGILYCTFVEAALFIVKRDTSFSVQLSPMEFRRNIAQPIGKHKKKELIQDGSVCKRT